MNRLPRSLILACATTLAACESSFNVDVVVNPLPPSNQAQLTATVRIQGIELQTTDDQSREVDRNAVLELTGRVGNLALDPVDLISNANIDSGEYVGLRLRFATNEGRVTSSRINVPQRSIGSGSATAPLADVAFMFEEDEDEVSLIVVLDLPLSLSDDPDGPNYVLDPVVRAMERSDAATIQGNIPASRLDDPDCEPRASVYAFAGADVDPDERDGQGAEPVATTLVTPANGVGSTASYVLDFLEPGTYSLALTCDGEREDGLEAADPRMDFSRGPDDLDLDAGEILRANFWP